VDFGLSQLHATRVSIIGRSLLILLVFISLTACSYPGVIRLLEMSSSQSAEQLNNSLTRTGLPAEEKNTVAMSFAEAYSEPKRATSFAEEYLINGCMAAKGYTVTW
jgi:cytochrome c biogenesis protein ResB